VSVCHSIRSMYNIYSMWPCALSLPGTINNRPTLVARLYRTRQHWTCHSQIFQVQILGQCSRGKYPYSLKTFNVPKSECRISRGKPVCKLQKLKSRQLDPGPCSHFDTILACDTHTGTWRYHASTASWGKKWKENALITLTSSLQ